MEESAKRRIPHVDPVISNGIRYEVLRGARSRGFKQNGGVIAAIDVASGKELWTLLVYTTVYDEKEEADVQDVFITELKLSGDGQSLIVKNEARKQFVVRLSDRSISEKQCRNVMVSSRGSLPLVEPIEIDGVLYQQDTESFRHGGDQPGGYLVAIDPKTGDRLWMLKVYPVEDHRAAGVTGGGLYFRCMSVMTGGGKALEIVNEAGGRYRVDIAQRTSEQIGGPPEKAAPATPAKPKPKL